MAIPGGGEEAASQYLLGQAGRGRGTLVGRGQGAGGWPRGLSGGRCGKSAHACVRAEALKTRGSTVHRQVKRRKCRSDLMGQPGCRLIEPMAARCPPGAWRALWHRAAVGARATSGRRQRPSLSPRKPQSGPSLASPMLPASLSPTERMSKPAHPPDTPTPSTTRDTKKPPKTHARPHTNATRDFEARSRCRLLLSRNSQTPLEGMCQRLDLTGESPSAERSFDAHPHHMRLPRPPAPGTATAHAHSLLHDV